MEKLMSDTSSKNLPGIPTIFYSSRTHKQIEQVIREFKKTAYSQTRMTLLSSKERSCIQACPKDVTKTQNCDNLLDPTTVPECGYFKKRQVISSYKGLSELDFSLPWDIEDFMNLGRREGACPYFAAKSLMQESYIVFCPYNYLIDPFIRETMQINLKNHVIIIDEGHNVEDTCREVGSFVFREDHLSEVIRDCFSIKSSRSNEAYEFVHNFLVTLTTLISEQNLNKQTNSMYETTTSDFWTGEETWMLFKTYDLDDSACTDFGQFVDKIIIDYKTTKDDVIMPIRKNAKDERQLKTIGMNGIKLLMQLKEVIKHIRNPELNSSYRCTITRELHKDSKVMPTERWTSTKEGQWLRSLKFLCMNAGLVFGSLTREARCVIVASGTLSPIGSFESELGTGFPHKVHANHVIGRDQVYARVVAQGPSGVPLRATYQNIQTLPFKDDLGALIGQVCRSVPRGVLCFFSSYSTLQANLERWQETDQWAQFQESKRVFVEPRQQQRLDQVMAEYAEAVENGGALLLAVFRGKVAEGIDFSDDFARCVVSIGIPYAVQYDPDVKLKREYNDLHQSKGLLSGREWYTIQAYRALNQALGRCIRHKNDWGAILLVDDRLHSAEANSYLCKWIREMKRDNRHFNLQKELMEFVKTKESLKELSI